MEANIDQFLQLVDEIEANSWFNSRYVQQPRNPASFTYSFDNSGERITEVPSEPFESLLLRVRRLTMNTSAENLHAIQKKAKSAAVHPNLQGLYDAWHKHWRLAFIKEPYLLEVGGKTQVMTAFKSYNAFINGRLFHTESRYNIIFFRTSAPANIRTAHLFIKNQFHWTVSNLCIAALGLRFLIVGGGQPLVLSGQVCGVTDFIWCRNQLPQVDEQYKIFSDWIEQNGGCTDCRW